MRVRIDNVLWFQADAETFVYFWVDSVIHSEMRSFVSRFQQYIFGKPAHSAYSDFYGVSQGRAFSINILYAYASCHFFQFSSIGCVTATAKVLALRALESRVSNSVTRDYG
jgi:hypothetical protein